MIIFSFRRQKQDNTFPIVICLRSAVSSNGSYLKFGGVLKKFKAHTSKKSMSLFAAKLQITLYSFVTSSSSDI